MGSRSVNDLSDHLLDSITKSVIDNTINYLKPAANSGLLGRELVDWKLVESHSVDVQIAKKYRTMFYNIDKIINNFNPNYLKKYKISKKELKVFFRKKIRYHKELIGFFFGLLDTYKQIDLINFGDYYKDKVMVKRMADRSLSIKYVYRFPKKNISITAWDHMNKNYYKSTKKLKGFRNKIEPLKGSYDPTTRPWFIGSEKIFVHYNNLNSSEHPVFWTQPYVFTSDQIPGIACSIPISNHNKKMIGVISIHLGIIEISTKYLSNLKIAKSGRVVILNENGDIIAYVPHVPQAIKSQPEKEKLIEKELKSLVKQLPRKNPNASIKYKLTPIQNIHDKIFHAAFKSLNITSVPNGKSHKYVLNQSIKKTFSLNNINYITVFSPFSSINKDSTTNWKWIVGIVIPEDDLLGTVKSNTYYIIVISIITVIISFAIGIFIAARISKPLDILSKETVKIREFKLDNPLKLDTSFIEMDQMSNAFYNMQLGLKSFEKFVPSDLVRFLIQSGKEAKLEGENRVLTVFFSDIAGFTTISESLTPDQLVINLGEYLDEMSSIILQNEGTVDKYIGDAVMAFWGAPKDCPDHAYLACKSAIESQKKLAWLRYTKWKSEGKPLFESRIGINTGDLIVGNMGSEKRMNYTVLGDTVNLASRLEGINKYYGTNIICGEMTHQLVKDRIVTRKIDIVAVKGKSEAVGIYEVVGLIDDLNPKLESFIEKYQEALEYYLDRNFKEARELFRQALIIKLDEPAKQFIQRCDDYINHPPDQSWNGVYVFNKK